MMMALVSLVCFAFVPTSAKIAMDEGSFLFFSILSLNAISAFLLLPLLFLKNTSVRVPMHLIWRFVVSGLLALFLLAATYHPVNFLNVGVVLLILYSFPLGFALVFHPTGKERSKQSQWLCMAMAQKT